ALQRLEIKRGLLDSELKTLEHDFEGIARPLEDLAVLAEQESAAREGLQRLDAERREAIAADARRQLAEDHQRRDELERLRAVADADRGVGLAAELRRITEEDASTRTAVFTLREALARQGYDPERIQALTARFARLTDAQHRLLRTQSEHALVYQTEIAGLEQ